MTVTREHLETVLRLPEIKKYLDRRERKKRHWLTGSEMPLRCRICQAPVSDLTDANLVEVLGGYAQGKTFEDLTPRPFHVNPLIDQVTGETVCSSEPSVRFWIDPNHKTTFEQDYFDVHKLLRENKLIRSTNGSWTLRRRDRRDVTPTREV